MFYMSESQRKKKTATDKESGFFTPEPKYMIKMECSFQDQSIHQSVLTENSCMYTMNNLQVNFDENLASICRQGLC